MIAHRGDRDSFPENTLEAFVSALNLGASAIELDVQITADQVAVISHDVDLARCCSVNGNITLMTEEQIQKVTPYEPQRFDTKFYGIRIPTLQSVVDYFNDHQNIEVFVEIKIESIQQHGQMTVLDCLYKSLKHAKFKWSLISFDAAVLKEARLRFHWNIGWVLSADQKWDNERINSINPQFVFASLEELRAHADQLPSGKWDWVIYGVNHADDLKFLIARNIFNYETDRLSFVLRTVLSGIP